jgi:hypothetical protein
MTDMQSADAIEGADINVEQLDAYVPTPFDELAKSMGWKPPTEYAGTEEFRSAEDYIKHGIAGTKRLKNDLKAVKDTADRLARTSATITAKALEEQRRELEDRHDQAVEDGDKEEARRVAKELAKIDDAPDKSDVRAAVADFTSRNPWYGTHAKATDYAAMISQRLAREGKPVQDQLEAAEEEIRERFPELFEKPKKAPAVHNSTARVSNHTPKDKGIADLPAEARRAGEDYVKMVNQKMPGKNYTLADYAKVYWSENG